MADLTKEEQFAKDFTIAILRRSDFEIDFKDNTEIAKRIHALYTVMLGAITPKQPINQIPIRPSRLNVE